MKSSAQTCCELYLHPKPRQRFIPPSLNPHSTAVLCVQQELLWVGEQQLGPPTGHLCLLEPVQHRPVLSLQGACAHLDLPLPREPKGPEEVESNPNSSTLSPKLNRRLQLVDKILNSSPQHSFPFSLETKKNKKNNKTNHKSKALRSYWHSCHRHKDQYSYK